MVFKTEKYGSYVIVGEKDPLDPNFRPTGGVVLTLEQTIEVLKDDKRNLLKQAEDLDKRIKNLESKKSNSLEKAVVARLKHVDGVDAVYIIKSKSNTTFFVLTESKDLVAEESLMDIEFELEEKFGEFNICVHEHGGKSFDNWFDEVKISKKVFKNV